MTPPQHQTPHPMLPAFLPAEMVAVADAKGIEHLVSLIAAREQAITLAATDPLQHGFGLEPWVRADELLTSADELLILGGNRSGKSEYCARRAVQALVAKERATVWCLHSTADSSVELQQPVIRRWLPPEWRAAGKKGTTTNVRWTDKGGFPDGVFVLPNGSRCRFLNYSMNVSVIEGGECDLIWCDELVPQEWVETLRYRLVTRAGKLLISFTPVKGYSRVVHEYMAGGVVQSGRPAPLLPASQVHVPGCPPGEMPYVLQPFRKNARAICFHTECNPFGGYAQLVKMLDGKTRAEVKIRAYGWAERLEGRTFPKFDPGIHGVPAEKIPAAGTRYCVADPAGSKNWFIKWYLVDDLGRVFLYREWPDLERFGEWALPGEKADGKPGPAQTLEAGRSITGYKRLILEAEGWRWNGKEWEEGPGAERIHERLIDPRLGGAAVPSAEEGTSIISLMADEQRDAEGRLAGPPMDWTPAPGVSIEEGIQSINDWLDWDDRAPLTALNCPRYYVSTACGQTLYALLEYTGRDGLKGALKDVVDPDRYLFRAGPERVTETTYLASGGGGY